jgi:hypothetical protein
MTAHHNAPNDAIRSIIGRLARENIPVTITRHIKGLCFKQKVKIVSMCHDLVAFRAVDIRLFASGEGHVFLHSPQFPSPVRASQIDCDIRGSVFILSGFEYLDTPFIDRCQDRVLAPMPAYISITSNKRQIIADLVDINPCGIGVFVKKSYARMANLVPDACVSLDFRLPAKFAWKDLKGTIIYFTRASPLLAKVGIRLQPNPTQSCMLEGYLAYRRKEILEEIDRVFFRAMEPRKVEDLYF